MDVVSALQLIYGAIHGIVEAAEQVEGNKQSCTRLAQRCSNLLPHLQTLEQSTDEAVVDILSQLLLLLVEAKDFVVNFQKREYFRRVWRRNRDAEAFNDFNVRISQAVHDLQLGLTIDMALQREQNLDDSCIDTEAMFALVQQMMRESGELGQSVLAELQAARHEQLRRSDEIANRVEDAIGQIVGVAAAAADIVQKIDQLEKRVDFQHTSKQFDRRQLQFEENAASRIDHGSFGHVYRGTYQGVDVAVKVVRLRWPNATAIAEMRREAEIHQILNGPRVIQLYGADITDVGCTLVMELAYCTMYDWLYNEDTVLNISTSAKIHVLYDAACGLEYLHSCDVIHRGIKPKNCLVTSGFRIKLADFGLARVKTTDSMGTQHNKGTPPYMAPEILAKSPHYTKAVDVFALGVMMNEVMTEHVPFSHLDFDEIKKAVLENSARPPIFEPPAGDGIAADVARLIQRAWHQNRLERPPAAAVSMAFKQLCQSIGQDPRQHIAMPPYVRRPTQPGATAGSTTDEKDDEASSSLSSSVQLALDDAWNSNDVRLIDLLEPKLKQIRSVEQRLQEALNTRAAAKSTRDAIADS